MTPYYFHLDYNDLYIAKFKVYTNDINVIYKRFSEKIIKDGFKRGVSLHQQMERYKLFCDKIYKLKDHCRKIRASDFFMFMSCYCALVKFNYIKPHEYMFLKSKSKKKSKIQKHNLS